VAEPKLTVDPGDTKVGQVVVPPPPPLPPKLKLAKTKEPAAKGITPQQVERAVAAAAKKAFKPIVIIETDPVKDPAERQWTQRRWAIGVLCLGLVVALIPVISRIVHRFTDVASERLQVTPTVPPVVNDPPPAPAPREPVVEVTPATPPVVEAAEQSRLPAQPPPQRPNPPVVVSIAPTTPPSATPPPRREVVRKQEPPPAPPPPPPAPKPELKALTNRPAPAPLAAEIEGVTDAQIGEAIQKGVDWVLGAERSKASAADARSTSVPARLNGARQEGEAILAIYALLQCGKAINDPRLDIKSPFMANLVNAIKKTEDFGRLNTYIRGIRASALSLYNRKEDKPTLSNDVSFLLKAHRGGAYTYGMPWDNGRRRTGSGGDGWDVWDNSNCQYGLLGVWAGAEAGIEIQKGYWQAVADHWRKCQLENGQWDYGFRMARGRMPAMPGGRATNWGTTSMTAAGTASLFVAEEFIQLAGPYPKPDVGRPPMSDSLAKAMQWWNEGDNGVSVNGQWGYTLYGIERVGLASGYKHVGTHDWYRELAAQAIAKQKDDGSWQESLVDTSFALLFLSRGRHPILMNKLSYDGFWANRPRDTANLARYAGKRIEREFNWQVVSLAADWTDWLDSPVLYIGGHLPVKFTNEQLDKLRTYVEAGGTIFTHADADSESFNTFAAELANKLFPQYELKALPPDHVLYNVLFDVKSRPPLKAVHNGARLLMVHSPKDIARSWQRRDYVRAKEFFDLGVNLFVYAAGKRDFRNRLDIGRVSLSHAAATMTVPVARVRYPGNWNPEPGAWRQYAGWFKQQTGMALRLNEVLLKELSPTDAPGAHLTGSGPYKFTADECAAIKRYVEGGGVLVIDSCGGGKTFNDLARATLEAVFKDGDLKAVSHGHPLVNTGAAGMEDVSIPQVRVAERERKSAVNMVQMLRAEKGCVLLTPVDITCGMLGVTAAEVTGYTTPYARSLMKNVIFWTLDGRAEERESATN
jgi:hypothetical protein